MKNIILICLVLLQFDALGQSRPIPSGGSSRQVPHDPTGGGTWNGKVSYTKLKTISGLDHPEGVLISNDSFFVSDMGEQTSGDLKDGKIFKYKFNGNLDSIFRSDVKLISPMGMSLVENILYIADQTRVIGISSITGAKEKFYDLSSIGATFLNDIEVVKGRYLFVTATNLKKIICIDLFRDSIIDFEFDLLESAPNGIVYDDAMNILYVAGNKKHELGSFGNGIVLSYKLSLNSLKADLINRLFTGRFLDGIVLDKDSVVISDWYSRGADGRLYHLEKSSFSVLHETFMQTNGLADFDYSGQNRLLVTPDLVNGRVNLYRRKDSQ